MTIALKPKNAEPIGMAGLLHPQRLARVIRSEQEAIDVAVALAKDFAATASDRDRTRAKPIAELDAFSQSGLWSINVPKEFGGSEVSYAVLAKVIEIISAADPSIGQIPQTHLGVVAAIRTVSEPRQQQELFAEILKGVRLGNAFSEFKSARAADFETKFTDRGDHVVVTGKKFYSTGALFAHLVPIAALDDQGRAWYAIANRNASGLTVLDDWSSFGQRAAFSGTTLIDNVRVPKSRLVPAYKGYDRPTADGAIFQIIQAAVDTGIAKNAIDDTIALVRGEARAWVDSAQEQASDDPYTIHAVGDIVLRLHAAQALLEVAGRAVDRAVADPTQGSVAEAQVAVAEATVLSTEAAIASTNKLFELVGARSTLSDLNLDRHWRNARTHTLHDPVRWKYAMLGNYHLNGVNPPLQAWS